MSSALCKACSFKSDSLRVFIFDVKPVVVIPSFNNPRSAEFTLPIIALVSVSISSAFLISSSTGGGTTPSNSGISIFLNSVSLLI